MNSDKLRKQANANFGKKYTLDFEPVGVSVIDYNEAAKQWVYFMRALRKINGCRKY